jgi:hypothetical protein
MQFIDFYRKNDANKPDCMQFQHLLSENSVQ